MSQDRRLRIWHILETYPPDYGGGAAITTRDICRHQAEQGHDIRVLCAEAADTTLYSVRTDFDGPVRVDRINLPYFKTIDPDGWQLGLMRWKRHERQIHSLLKKLLLEWQPDLVDYHASRPFGEECLTTIAEAGIPIVATLHEGWLICPRLMFLRSPTSQACSGPGVMRCMECLYSYYDGDHPRAAIKLPWRIVRLGSLPAYRLWRRTRMRKKVAGAIARSNFLMKMYQPHINGPVVHVPLGIDLSDLTQRQVRHTKAPIKFGFVAGFQQSKGVWHLLDAASSLKREGLEFELHIWGPGQETGEDEITSRGLQDRVFLRGMYMPEAKWQIYSNIDVAVMATTVCEPLGRVPQEAAVVGVPTIAPAIGGIVESIRDGVDGLLYAFRDSQDLERQMRRVVKEPELLSNLIDNQRQVPDVRLGIPEIEKFYFTVLDIFNKNAGMQLR